MSKVQTKILVLFISFSLVFNSIASNILYSKICQIPLDRMPILLLILVYVKGYRFCICFFLDVAVRSQMYRRWMQVLCAFVSFSQWRRNKIVVKVYLVVATAFTLVKFDILILGIVYRRLFIAARTLGWKLHLVRNKNKKHFESKSCVLICESISPKEFVKEKYWMILILL